MYSIQMARLLKSLVTKRVLAGGEGNYSDRRE
jgi:hypothetical protein